LSDFKIGPRWLWVVGLGIALGVATAWVDVRAGGLEQNDLWRAASMLLNAGSTWATLAIVSGWLIGRPVPGAIAGVVALGAAVGGYYMFGLLAGDRTQVGLDGLSGAIRLWVVMAIVAGPVLGLIGALIRRPGRVGSTSTIVIPVGVFVEMVVLRRLGSDTFAVDPALAWTQTAMIIASILGAAIILVRRFRQTATEPQDLIMDRGIEA
jgi:Family of unknown function (DUF6518)